MPLIQFQCQSTELFVTTEKRILVRRELIASDRVRVPGNVLDARELALLDAVYDEARRALVDEVPAS